MERWQNSELSGRFTIDSFVFDDDRQDTGVEEYPMGFSHCSALGTVFAHAYGSTTIRQTKY
jgi:hypothetical protein